MVKYVKFVLLTNVPETEKTVYYATNYDKDNLDASLRFEALRNAEDNDYKIFGDSDAQRELAIEYSNEHNVPLTAAIEYMDEVYDEYYKSALTLSYWEEVTKEEYEANEK